MLRSRNLQEESYILETSIYLWVSKIKSRLLRLFPRLLLILCVSNGFKCFFLTGPGVSTKMFLDAPDSRTSTHLFGKTHEWIGQRLRLLPCCWILDQKSTRVGRGLVYLRAVWDWHQRSTCHCINEVILILRLTNLASSCRPVCHLIFWCPCSI